MNTPTYTLRQLVLYFLQLGALGFGGPVALASYMRRDLVETRRWITDTDYRAAFDTKRLRAHGAQAFRKRCSPMPTARLLLAALRLVSIRPQWDLGQGYALGTPQPRR